MRWGGRSAGAVSEQMLAMRNVHVCWLYAARRPSRRLRARCVEVLARVSPVPILRPFSLKIAAAGLSQWFNIDYSCRKQLTHLWAPACPRSGDRTRPFDKALSALLLDLVSDPGTAHVDRSNAESPRPATQQSASGPVESSSTRAVRCAVPGASAPYSCSSLLSWWLRNMMT